MRRFFVRPDALRGREVTLDAALAHRLRRVLRMRRGDHILLADGRGREYEVELTSLSARAGTGVVVGQRQGQADPAVTVVLYQSLIKANRFDWLLEKGTELGVARFAPVISARSVVRSGESRRRQERWQRIVREAAEQCGRSRLPEVDRPVLFREAVGSAPGLRLLPWEGLTLSSARGEVQLGLRSALREAEGSTATVSLFIGPEGGFTEEEVTLARRQGARIVSLGRRILRAETAAIVAATLVFTELGELGN